MRSLVPFAEEPRPGFLRLAHEDHVGQLAEVIFADRYPRSAHHGKRGSRFQGLKDLSHPETLHAHPRHADDVRVGDAVEVQRRYVFVKQRDVMRLGSQGRQKWQTRHRQIGPFAKQRQSMFEPPIGSLEAWIDDDNVGHDRPRRDVQRRSTEYLRFEPTTHDQVLLGHCAGDRRTSGLNTTQITRFPLDWLYDRKDY